MSDRLQPIALPAEVVMSLEERTWRIHQHAEDAAIEIGQELIAAKAEHPGRFTEWVTAELPFGIDVAERIMAISACAHLTDPSIRASLPSAYSALYQLSRPPIHRLRQGITNGEVHPDMTYREASEWASQNTNGRPPVEVPPPSASPLGDRAEPRISAEVLAKELMRYPTGSLSGEMTVKLRTWLQ
jgi:hypothetical protein